VVDTEFKATEAAVDNTIGNYNNVDNRNIKLWLSGQTSMWYSGFLQSEHVQLVPQENLLHADTIVTIILPSANIEHVSASSSGPANTPGGVVPAYGLNGQLDTASDRLWTTLRFISDCYENARVEGLSKTGLMEFQLPNGRRIIVDLKN
jgi:hypothetical protein